MISHLTSLLLATDATLSHHCGFPDFSLLTTGLSSLQSSVDSLLSAYSNKVYCGSYRTLTAVVCTKLDQVV